MILRPSSFPNWNDCARRTAAQLFEGMITTAGYTLRQLGHGIGASVGTSVHRGAAVSLEEKLTTGIISPEDVALDAGVEALQEQIAQGVTWDNSTANPGTAEIQVIRMTRAYRNHVAAEIDPIAVEERLEADAGDGFILSGKKDVLCRVPGGLNDLKTGRVKRSNYAQYGSYSLIERAHGREVKSITENFVRRGSIKKPQDQPEKIVIDPAMCENAAVETIADIKRSVDEFNRRLLSSAPELAPENAFRANPNSMLCSEKYCRAWGSNFCRMGKT